ncbi:MAG TPA: hypothetical protein VM470_02660 [Acidimicrobiia bacterium]|nr:hypothetical protein [Acidimicrobiia bacterium]
MASQRTIDAVEGSDTDELLRIIDGHCKARAWEELLEMRRLCAEALTRGKQLWGVDEHIRYRLALEAPASLAAAAVDEGPARFALGPLTEVAASRHTFADLAPYLAPGPSQAWIAHERVLRGETIDPDLVDPTVVELPLVVHGWEGSYCLAEYKGDRLEVHPPPLPELGALAITDQAEGVDDPDGTAALEALVAPWVEESNGRVSVVCAEGDLSAAMRLLGVRSALASVIGLSQALPLMAWAGASGGAHGRRKGSAAGRLAAWWALTALTGLSWPPSPEELGEAGQSLQWQAWSDLGEGPGWNLRLAATSRLEGLTWAVAASDAV